ncbi:MAG: hypothetical protein LC734_04185 [Acidobacteria bacterium]|nr:hypothetical protein [Acidobacteriota bacterium]
MTTRAFTLIGIKTNLCSYMWRESPWLSEFNGEHAEAVEGGEVKHYVLLGGDYNVEILAIGDVSISVTKDV